MARGGVPHRRVSKSTVSRCSQNRQHECQSHKCCKSVKGELWREFAEARRRNCRKSASTAEDTSVMARGIISPTVEPLWLSRVRQLSILSPTLRHQSFHGFCSQQWIQQFARSAKQRWLWQACCSIQACHNTNAREESIFELWTPKLKSCLL